MGPVKSRRAAVFGGRQVYVIGRAPEKTEDRNMIKMLAVILLTCGGASLLAAQAPPDEQNVLLRRYREGKKLT